MTYLNTFETTFDVIVLTEAHIQNTPRYSNIENMYNLKGYVGYHTKSTIKFGGITIYVKDTFNVNCISELTKATNSYDSLYLKICTKQSQKALIIGAYYRHCRHSKHEYIKFTSVLEQHLSHNKIGKHNIVIAGDFNICLLKSISNLESLALLNTILQNGLETHIYKPTRIEFYKDSMQVKSASLIDHIHSNLYNHVCTSGNLYYPDSDHYANFVVFENFLKNNREEKNDVFRRDYKNIDANLLVNDFNNTNWEILVYNEINLEIASQNLIDIIEDLFEKHVPLKKLSNHQVKYVNKPWINPELLREIRTKNQAHNKYKNNPTAMNKEHFNILRNNVTRRIRQSKKEYFKKYFEKSRNDSKRMWQGINEALNQTKNKKQLPSQIKNEQGEIMEDPQNIADSFATYFEKIPLKTKSKIKKSNINSHYLQYLHKMKPINNYLVLHNSSTEEIYKLLLDLKDNSSSGPMNAPNKFLKVIAQPLSQILVTIINRSMEIGYVPNSFKVGQQTPVFKSGDVSIQNFRPITVSNSLSKILEKTVRSRIIKFIKDNKIINNSQFGFRKNHSTNHAIINLLESSLEVLDLKLKVGGVFLDISKAFDCVDHDILLRKLEYYGFRDRTLMWLESYLTNRTQFVRTKGKKSRVYSPMLGVPQGGVLAPILFILFTNDIIQSSSVLDFSIYADDTCLILCINRDNYSDILTLELSKVMDWFDCNELLLNIEKTDYLHFGPHYPKKYEKGEINMSDIHDVGPLYFFERTPYEPEGPSHIELNKKGEYILSDLQAICPYYALNEYINTLDNTMIMESNEVKYLGLYIDNKLEFSKQINILCCKINRMTGIFWKCPDIDLGTKKVIYHSLVESYLNYGILIWGSNFNKQICGSVCEDYTPSNLKPLKKAQNQVLRAIFRKKKYYKTTKTNTPSSPLYKELEVLKLYDLYCYNLAILCFEYYHNKNFPEKIGELFTPRSEISQRETRQHHLDLHVSNKIRLANTCKKPSVAGSAFWNKLPDSIKNISSKKKFKIKLKDYLINQY